MAKRRARAKMNIPMCAACVLLCLTLFSMHFSGGVVARYSTTASGSDSARVIQFGQITLTRYGEETQYLYPGAELIWNVDVNFTGSESATYVFLEVTPTANCEVSGENKTIYTFKSGSVNSGASWTVDTTSEPKWTFLKADSGSYVYYISLDPNKPLSNRPFFGNEDNKAMVSADLTADEIAALGTIKADFSASVVQSNGFTSVEEAWASLETKHPITNP